MTQQFRVMEPTNLERAHWAKNALAVFTTETYSGDHPDSMHADDLEAAIGDLICDLLHFANYHPRLDATEIHEHARAMFEQELAEEKCNSSPAEPLDALFRIKHLAEKSGDHETDPDTLLDLIAHEARNAIAKAKGGAI